MTLEDLRVFVAVCESRSLAAVARATQRTHSAISQHVGRLEAELGTALLERRTRGVVPTAAGAALWRDLVDALGAIDSGLRRVREMRDDAGSLTIATGGTTVRHFLKSSVVRFRREWPDTQLSFEPASSSLDCIEAVRRGTADLGLVTLDERVRGIEQHEIASQSIWLLVPREDPLAGRKRIRLSELAECRLIALHAQTTSGSLIEEKLRARDVAADVIMRVDDFDTAAVFVELGLGVTIVPAVQARSLVKSRSLRAILVGDVEPLTVAWAARSWAALPPAALRFDATFRSQLKSMARATPGLSVPRGGRSARA